MTIPVINPHVGRVGRKVLHFKVKIILYNFEEEKNFICKFCALISNKMPVILSNVFYSSLTRVDPK